MLGRDNRLRAVGQSGFFRKLALRTAADAEVPKGENFPPPRLEPDVVATTPAEPAAAAPLIDLQGGLQLSTFTCTLTFGGREIDIYSPSNWRAEPVERPASVRICNVCVWAIPTCETTEFSRQVALVPHPSAMPTSSSSTVDSRGLVELCAM